MNKLNIDISTNNYEIKNIAEINEFCLQVYNYFGFTNTAFLSIEFCNSAQIKEINNKYRLKNTDTDVLSFEYYENLAQNKDQYHEQILNLGDILISYDYVQNQAQNLGNTFETECIFLVCHGMLHLLGYDHLNEVDEQKMIQMQKKLFGDYHERVA